MTMQDPTSATEAIHSFGINVREEELVELRQRMTATRWPKRRPWQIRRRVQLATPRELARYWATDYNWRKAEAKLNALPQLNPTRETKERKMSRTRFLTRVTGPLPTVTVVGGLLVILGLASQPWGSTSASATTNADKPTIVLVHGSFADASGWAGVIERLQKDGYPVLAPSNPLRSLSGDSAYIKSVLEQIPGPLVVVAHSYGGAVITNAAAGNANVKALVYIDGFLPDIGEDALHLAGEESQAASSIEPKPFPPFGPNDLDFYIRQDVFREVFAADVNAKTAEVMSASQRPAAAATFGEPTTAAAWRTVPSWALIGRQDKIITPDALRSMATRAGSTVVEIDSSHVSMISHPKQVADLIKQAADATD